MASIPASNCSSRHRLNPAGMLDLHLARHQKRKNFEVGGRLIAGDLLNGLFALVTEVQQQRLHELLVQQMTCTVPVAVGVARNPLLERHGALHVGRLVLNVSKYLFGLAECSKDQFSLSNFHGRNAAAASIRNWSRSSWRGCHVAPFHSSSSSAPVKSPDFLFAFCFSALTASSCVSSSTILSASSQRRSGCFLRIART